MNIDFSLLEKYENKIFNIIEKYSKIFNLVINFLNSVFLKLVTTSEKLIFGFITIISKTGLLMRYSTYPLHWIWIKWDIKKFDTSDIKELPLFQLGSHYIYGLPKAGKSTFTYHAMMDYAYLTGKTSYTTHPMELPRKNVFGHDYFYHQHFRPEDNFIDGKQEYAFDTKHHNVIVYEEMIGDYHQRNNSKNSHNNEILPLVASMAGQRHQGEGIDLFIFISQLPGNDISIMQMLAGYHIPRIVKRFDYKHWLNTGKYKWSIKGWKVESYKIQVTGRHDYKLIDKVNWFYDFKYEDDFKYFNKFNLSDRFKNKKILKAREMIS